ncbi:MAG: 50S ribosomal protein L17 [Verrucomicrobiota bacterium]
MRHRRKTVKLQRDSAHRRSLLANLACSLIEHGRIRTTLAKAKALKPVADKLVTLGKRNELSKEKSKNGFSKVTPKALHARRQALAFLRQDKAVKKLFEDIAPAAADRQGGYTRVVKLGARESDSAQMAFIEWVDSPVAAGDSDDD